MARGRHVGFRKLDADRGTWIARFRGPDGKMRFHSLGPATTEFAYDKAKAQAQLWFATQEDCTPEIDGKRAPYSVEEACKDLVAARRKAYEDDLAARGVQPFPGELPAWKDAEGRFKRTVYNTDFGARELAKLTTAHITDWLKALKQTKSTQNRNLEAVKAALNRAAESTPALASLLTETKKAKKHKTGEPTRKLPFLDLQQRRALLSMCGEGGDYRDFVLAHMLTGARCGEIARLRRHQFDARTKSVTFCGKTGPRTIPLTQDSVALFARRALQATPGEDSLLFTNGGKAWVNNDWCELTRGAARAAKSPPSTSLYALRHSWITQSLLDRVPALLVAKLAGTSLDMIQRHYGHLVVDRARDELSAVKYL